MVWVSWKRTNYRWSKKAVGGQIWADPLHSAKTESDTRFEPVIGMTWQCTATVLLYFTSWIWIHLRWHLGKKLSMEQFLRKLPETVVKAGKVISIRDSVKAHLQVSIVMFQSVLFRVVQSHFPLNWIFVLLRAFLKVPRIIQQPLWKHPLWENGIKNLIFKSWPNRRAYKSLLELLTWIIHFSNPCGVIQ